MPLRNEKYSYHLSDVLVLGEEMSAIIADGATERIITCEEKYAHLDRLVGSFQELPKRVLLLPPDHTRLYSDAGFLTSYLYSKLKDTAHVDVMPALGTHAVMNEQQLRMMFGDDIPLEAFLPHDWRNDVVKVGVVPGEVLKEVSGGKVDYSMDVLVNRALVEGGYDQIISIGQVVPHEVAGMANYTKNICVGVGGPDMINKSHFLGAVCNMETIMGRPDTPVRAVLNYGCDHFMKNLPITYILTVIGQGEGGLVMRGLYAGADAEAFELASKLSQQVNFDLLDKPIAKAVVYLTPKEFASTWLGNKSVYRTRMAMADDGELVVLAPAVKEFGEDSEIDRLIRKYGYKGTPATLKAVEDNDDLRGNLSAAAHLIHGSSEGRFKITYCTNPDLLSREEVEGAGFAWADCEEMTKKYNPENLKAGVQMVDGEEIFYVSNPALGLWALKSQFC